MKLYMLSFLLVLPLGLQANPVACPTGTFQDYINDGVCTISDYTLSNFVFGSVPQNNNSTAFTASQFSVNAYDKVPTGLSSIYIGIQSIGDPGSAAGSDVLTTFDFDISNTGGAESIEAVALALLASVGQGGSVTLEDSGTGDSQPFDLTTSNTQELAQYTFNPNVSVVHMHAILDTVGPDRVRDFQIAIEDAGDVPEPGAWSLTAFGLLPVGALVYWRRTKKTLLS